MWGWLPLRGKAGNRAFPNTSLFFSTVYITKHTHTDSTDPQTVAKPIGSRVSGNHFDMKYAPGTRTKAVDKMLWMNDNSLRPYAQKYPLKLKCTPAKKQSQIYPRRYHAPAAMTAASVVNSPTTFGAMNCTSTPTTAPKPSVRPMPYRSVAAARSWRPAPTSCAPSAETVDSIDDGTKNTKLMNFSTTPTAAASVRPRRFAMIVMRRNDT